MAIRVAAPWQRVLPIAAQVERWPGLLPHYRYVRRIPDTSAPAVPANAAPRGASLRRYAMGARRGPIPVRWEAVEEVATDARRIEFRHTGGVTRGMRAVWRFEPVDGGCEASIEHELTLRWPLIGRFAAEWIIGPGFIDPIAMRTLRRVKALAEAASVEPPR